MLGALSLPRPSRPWQPAQEDVKLRLPAVDQGLLPESFREACAKERTGVSAQHKQKAHTVRKLAPLILELAVFSLTENSDSVVKN